MDARYDPHLAGGPTAGRWTPQPGPAGAADNPGGDDGLVRLAGWILCLLAVLLSATVALGAGGLTYGLATWRRWQWWPLALTGTVGLLLVLAISGPGAALHHHLRPSATSPPRTGA